MSYANSLPHPTAERYSSKHTPYFVPKYRILLPVHILASRRIRPYQYSSRSVSYAENELLRAFAYRKTVNIGWTQWLPTRREHEFGSWAMALQLKPEMSNNKGSLRPQYGFLLQGHDPCFFHFILTPVSVI